jgi:hypothetical protein
MTPILADLLARPLDSGFFYNVNMPMLPPGPASPEVVWCELDPKPLPLNYRHEEETGLYYAGDYKPARPHARRGRGCLLRRQHRCDRDPPALGGAVRAPNDSRASSLIATR